MTNLLGLSEIYQEVSEKTAGALEKGGGEGTNCKKPDTEGEKKKHSYWHNPDLFYDLDLKIRGG